MKVKHGYCHCGCNRKTRIATKTDRRRGHIEGQPLRFIHGHNGGGGGRRFSTPPEQRFWKNVDKQGSDDCWEWQAGKTTNGYGLLYANGEQTYAHRLSCELHNGPIPSGMHVCHSCDNPSCVNPAHLFVGTHQDNMRDRDSKGRGNVKLTEEDIPQIRKMGADGMSHRAIARIFGVSHSTIGHILRGGMWKHVP